jgi:hypothetical protein
MGGEVMNAASLSGAAAMGTQTSTLLINALAFQAGWWAVVLSAARDHAAVGLLVVGLVLAWHLARVRPGRAEAALIAGAACIGLAFDSLLLATGWVEFAGGALFGVLAPLWMVALWANFAATLNVSLGALRARPWLAALLGGLGGPLAYWGGAGLGAMRLVEPLPALLVLAAGWAALTPLLFRLATWLEARPWR